MKLAKNLMEQIVSDNLEKEMKRAGCCMCDTCRTDVLTYALNRLPPKYAATFQGSLMSQIDVTELQLKADLLFALGEAAKVVKANPHHD